MENQNTNIPQSTPTLNTPPSATQPLMPQPVIMEQSQLKSKKNLWKYIAIILGGIAIVIAGVLLIINLFSERNVSRTIMIYMVGSDLESKSGLASDELAGIGDPELIAENNINVVLIAGGSKRWKNETIEADETSIYELTDDGFQKVETQNLRNMGDAEVLEDFLNYTTAHYKTDEYDLIFWNHGGAIQGAEYDELHGNDYLSITEMKEALEESEFGGKKKLETVIFSTCLNGTIEMADMFKDYARYFVASEEVSMSYAGASDFMFIEEILPSDEGYELGQKFVEKYQEKAANIKKLNAARGASSSLYSTYSVVDLAKIDDVKEALDDFFDGIDVLDDYKKIAQARANLYQYAQNNNGTADYDMVDLYNLVDSLDELSTASAERVQQAIEEAVIYNYATNMESRGISIYFPYGGSRAAKAHFMQYYNDIAPTKSYEKFVTNFYNVQNGNTGSKVMSLDDNHLETEATDQNTMEFRLELTEEQAEDFATAKYMVVRNNPDYPGYYWPTLIDGTAQLNGTTLIADVHNHQLSVKDGEEEHTITVIEKTAADGKVQYEFTVTLEDFRDDFVVDAAKITITGDQETGKVNVENVRLLDDEGLISGHYTSLDDYENIAFASSSYNLMNDDMSYNEDFESNGVIQGWEVGTNDLELKFQDEFETGYEYYCVFIVTDVYNNTVYSKFVKLNN